MDFQDLGNLFPLGGATLLLLALLKVWMAERTSWIKERKDLIAQYERERATLIAQCEAERRAMIEQHKQDIVERNKDLISHLEHLRQRVVDLEVEVAQLRDKVRTQP